MYNIISEFKYFRCPYFFHFSFYMIVRTQLLQNPRDTCLLYTYIRRTVFVFQNEWKGGG